MAPGNTTTGAVLEAMVLPALSKGGFTPKKGVNVGQRIGGGKHIVDVIAADAKGTQILVSLKWQQVAGTAEQKVPFEIISLADAIANSEGEYAKAYLVLGGSGWKLRNLYTTGGLDKYLHNVDSVTVMGLEEFVGLANQGRL
ncbi:MAG: hypothetical protein OXN15_00475 [Chloroflexota bacterium]|nr:hypothetical protein [Chloroflexota bacterium]